MDFGTALADPVAAVEQLLRFCAGNNNASTTNNNEGDFDRSLRAAAVNIAAGASRERTLQVLALSRTAVDVEHHFPTLESQQQQGKEVWTADFSSLPVVVQRLFERNIAAVWKEVRGSRSLGAKWGPAAVMALP